ncbi:FG-GAP-like repeat-containing protein [uncultured Draconibacterium sp.]|uniref:FG-GAP-like repeat-containing protein n=1 Tax=uncultured Draconibacterium sp. TaxID=1573823 RepID=UPI0029C6D768|nr:FG-GAP-like repeat-containing protein [uncultured Draconibacterium sp.]
MKPTKFYYFLAFLFISANTTAQTWDISNFLIEKKNLGNDVGIFKAVLIDINSDGLDDMIVTQQDFDNEDIRAYKVFKNEGDGNFSEDNTLLEDGAIQFHVSREYVVADFNNDNKDDIFFAGHGPDTPDGQALYGGGEQSQLWLQTANGKLENVSSTHLPEQKGLTHSADAGDIDNDGDLDLFLGNTPIYEYTISPRFHINDGDGIFVDYKGHIPSEIENLESNWLDWAFIDVDKDGFVDLIGGRGNAEYETAAKDVLLLNDGNLNFVYSSENALPVRAGGLNWGTQEFAVSDFNGDGYVDIIASAFNELNNPKLMQICFWENKKDGTYSDESSKIEDNAEEGEQYTGFSTVDINNDGWMEICASAYLKQPRIYLNMGNGNLQLIDDFPEEILNSAGVLHSDLDLDGDEDLLFFNGNDDIYIAWNKNNFIVETSPLPVPESPVLVSPISDEVVSKSPVFKWTPDGATVTVQIQVALDEDFTNLFYNNMNITAHDNFKINLGEDNTFFWRIRGANTAGTGEWSEVNTFQCANIVPDSIGLSNNVIYSNVKYGTTVGIFSASDEDENDTFTYSLINGNGTNDVDNSSFFISGDTLKTNTGISTSKEEFFINVQVHDGNGGVYTQEFTIFMLPSGLVACYPFNENANDECGEGYDGTVYGVSLTSDRFETENAAYYFDGTTGSSIYLGTGLGLINNSEAFTICAWINPEQLNPNESGQSTILSERKEGDNYQFAVMGDKLYFSYWVDENEYMFTSTTTILENSWQFVALTFNGNQLKLFINGEVDFTEDTSGNMNNHSSSLYIGAFDGENAVFKGKIDDVSIYNRSLSEVEINEKYKENTIMSSLVDMSTSDQILLYPNPTEKTININPIGLNELYNISIYNSLGQIIYKRIKVQPQRIETIALEDAKEGIYFVVVNTKSERFVEKLIVK